MMRTLVALTALLVIANSNVAFASSYSLDPDTEKHNPRADDARHWLEISQKAIGRQVGDHRFVDSDGNSRSFAEFRGRPVIVSLIYTSCAHVCPMITQRVRRAIAEAQRVMDPDRFVVLTVGFDSRNDTPMRMAAFARAQGAILPNWLFLSGDEASVPALARDLGFGYSAMAGGYVHAAQTTILDREGRVYRQVYGDDFPIQVFMEPLKEVVYGTVGTFLRIDGILDRVRFLCTVYDPNQGRYRVSYAIVVSFLTGVLSLGGIGFVLARAWLRSRTA